MKVFISSTYRDLIDYRERVAHAIERLGQQGVRMEVFGARPQQAAEACFDEIEASDVFVGIYAHRYGHIPAGSDISITEMEFDFAQKMRKPTLCFLVDGDYPWLPKQIEPEPGLSKLKVFKEKISSSVVRDTFTTPEDLAYKVAASLGRYLIMRKVKEQLEHAAKKQAVGTELGRDQVARRAERLSQIIRGARILLVNDIPAEMGYVIRILRGLDIEVAVATTSDQALSMLAADSFDAVISDMRRDDVPDEGIRFLKKMRAKGLHRPTIFTVGRYRPDRGTPAYAFGITNRIDDLLNLVFDILERVRG